MSAGVSLPPAMLSGWREYLVEYTSHNNFSGHDGDQHEWEGSHVVDEMPCANQADNNTLDIILPQHMKRIVFGQKSSAISTTLAADSRKLHSWDLVQHGLPQDFCEPKLGGSAAKCRATWNAVIAQTSKKLVFAIASSHPLRRSLCNIWLGS